jgi:hypothetical protein
LPVEKKQLYVSGKLKSEFFIVWYTFLSFVPPLTARLTKLLF